MQPDLTICVPTFNRLSYLRELLVQLVINLPGGFTLFVSDNRSPDGTWEWLNKFALGYPGKVRCFRQPENVGPFANQLGCVAEARSKYVWLICDDEILEPGAVDAVCKAIKSDADIYISSLGGDSINQFADHYSSPALFFEHAHRFDQRYLLAVGGWSQCVFKKAVFDFAACRASRKPDLKYPSTYPHHFALWSGQRSVGVIKRQLVRGRDPILPPPDGVVSKSSSDIQWAKCVHHINQTYGTSVPLNALSVEYSREHVGHLLRDPVGAIKKYGGLLSVPRNWPKAFLRLWHYFAR